jgi:hypothetical protein
MQAAPQARGEELLWGRQPGSNNGKCPCGLRQLHLLLSQRLLRQHGGLHLGLLGPWRVNPLMFVPLFSYFLWLQGATAINNKFIFFSLLMPSSHNWKLEASHTPGSHIRGTSLGMEHLNILRLNASTTSRFFFFL